MVEAIRCPYCQSGNVTYKAKARAWECNECEKRFEGGQPEEPPSSERLLSEKTSTPKAIFFSYGHDSNKELVDKFKADLERRGHSVWIDYKEIGTWSDWKGKITQGIHDSDLALAFLSAHATRDPGVCSNEIAMALNRFGTVYPLLLEPVSQVTPPVTISHLQWEDLSQWRDIRDSKVAGQDWGRWYEEKLIKLITLLEGEATEFEGDIRSLREVLRPLSFLGDIAPHIPDFTGRQWVFDSYEDWLKKRKDSRLFWIKAGPGVGKTAIAAMLAHAHQGAVVGAWFCQVNSIERRDIKRTLCSLAFQLATRWDDYRQKLRFKLGFNVSTGPDDWKDLHNELTKNNEADLFNLLFVESLAGLIWRDHRLVVVIDALDEATDEKGQNPLVDLLVTRLAHLPSWLNFVVTSRPNPEIVAKLQGFAPFELDAQDARNTEDLKAYLESGLVKREDFNALGRERQAQIVAVLLDKSEGMILYLQQILKGLDEKTLDLGGIEQAPKGLGSLYRIAFDRLYGGEKLEEVYDGKVKPLLGLLLAAPEELPPELAQEVLGLDKETWLRQRNLFGSYVTDTPQGIKLFHKTLHDWLQDEESAPYFIDAVPKQKQLAEYLWRCFDEVEDKDHVKWPNQVLSWLPKSLSQIPIWNSREALSRFGDYVFERYEMRGARVILERAIKLHESTGDVRNHSSVARNYSRLGYLEFFFGSKDEAFVRYKKSLEICRALASDFWTPDSRQDLASSLSNVAGIEQDRGQLDAALARYKESLEIRRALASELGTPDDRRDLARSLSDVADIELDQGQMDAALARYEESLKIYHALEAEVGTPESRRSLWARLYKMANIEQARGHKVTESKIWPTISEILDDIRNNVSMGSIFLIKDFYGISNFPAYYEPLFNALGECDVNDGKLIVCYGEKRRLQTKRFDFDRVANEVTYLSSQTEYIEHNIGAIRGVNDYTKAIGKELSSYQVIQLVEVDKVTQNLDEAFKRLQTVYEEMCN